MNSKSCFFFVILWIEISSFHRVSHGSSKGMRCWLMHIFAHTCQYVTKGLLIGIFQSRTLVTTRVDFCFVSDVKVDLNVRVGRVLFCRRRGSEGHNLWYDSVVYDRIIISSILLCLHVSCTSPVRRYNTPPMFIRQKIVYTVVWAY